MSKEQNAIDCVINELIALAYETEEAVEYKSGWTMVRCYMTRINFQKKTPTVDERAVWFVMRRDAYQLFLERMIKRGDELFTCTYTSHKISVTPSGIKYSKNKTPFTDETYIVDSVDETAEAFVRLSVHRAAG
jgi:hypothetical protein